MARAVKKTYEYSAQCGARIHAIRKERKLTLKHLANQAGFSQQLLSRIERGETNIPLESLQRIALALGVSVQQLFPASEDKPLVSPEIHYWLEYKRRQQIESLRNVVDELESLRVS